MTESTSIVREKYGETARSGLSSREAGVRAVAEAFGYSPDELASIPAEANMGLSCGNPTAMASLREGEVVVDLGSGGGLDVFLAADKVGPTGRAIGVDMSPDMIELARRNARSGPDGQPYGNVEFRLGEIDALPLGDATVDVIISNCVINLASDKPKVFAEMLRVLKPGGRVAISDIALKRELPAELAESAAALVGCIAGAIPIQTYREQLTAAGFAGVEVVDAKVDLMAYGEVEGQSGCCSPNTTTPEAAAPGASGGGCCTPAPEPVTLTTWSQSSSCCGDDVEVRDTPRGGDEAAEARVEPAKPMHRDLAALLAKYDLNAYAASVKIFAVKPGA